MSIRDNPKPQGKRRGYCACGFLLLFMAAFVAIWLIRTSSQYSRTRVVVATDPISHCRLEYTISSRYTRQHVPAIPAKWLGYAIYVTKPPPKLFAWLEAHLPGRPVGHITFLGKQLNRAQTKVEDSWQAPTYITPAKAGGIMKTIEFKHILVANRTAVWDVSEWAPNKPGNHRTRTYSLIVHPLYKPVSYFFDCVAEREEDRAKMRAEMVAIRDSIKISGL